MCKLLITVYLYSLSIILMGISLDDDANLLMHNISWKTDNWKLKMITIYTLRTRNMSAWVVALFNFCKLTTNMSIFELIWTNIMAGKLFRNFSTNNMSGSINIDLVFDSTSPLFELGILDLSSNNFSDISNFSSFSSWFQKL
jgi:hypothetical protein